MSPLNAILITLPRGWIFCKGSTDSPDRIVNESSQSIDIQSIVKEFLRRKKRGPMIYPVNERDSGQKLYDAQLAIYFRRFPETAGTYLEYIPRNNGAACSLSVGIKTVSPKSETTSFFSPVSAQRDSANSSPRSDNRVPSPVHTGLRWFEHPNVAEKLPTQRLQAVIMKAEQQRANRRHTGDSPSPT